MKDGKPFKFLLGVAVVALFLTVAWSTTAARFISTSSGTLTPRASAARSRVNPRLRTKPRIASTSTSTATVETNYGDYQPGDTVEITGSGWQPTETVALRIDESDGDLPWQSSATADSTGNIQNNQFVIQTHDRGVSFELQSGTYSFRSE